MAICLYNDIIHVVLPNVEKDIDINLDTQKSEETFFFTEEKVKKLSPVWPKKNKKKKKLSSKNKLTNIYTKKKE